MHLELGCFQIKDVRFAAKTAIEDRVLSVNRAELCSLLEREPLRQALVRRAGLVIGRERRVDGGIGAVDLRPVAPVVHLVRAGPAGELRGLIGPAVRRQS